MIVPRDTGYSTQFRKVPPRYPPQIISGITFMTVVCVSHTRHSMISVRGQIKYIARSLWLAISRFFSNRGCSDDDN